MVCFDGFSRKNPGPNWDVYVRRFCYVPHLNIRPFPTRSSAGARTQHDEEFDCFPPPQVAFIHSHRTAASVTLFTLKEETVHAHH